MFKLFKKSPKTVKIEPQQLLIDTDYALNDMGSSAEDDLLSRLGLSREQVYAAVMSDDEVAACRADVVAALLASAWRLYGEDTDEAQQNQLYKNLRQHLPTLAEQVVVAQLCGFSVARIVYEQDESGFVSIKHIISRHDELSNYDPKFNKLIYNGKNGTVDVDTQISHLFLTHNATSKNPAGEMAMVRIYPAVMLRKDGWRYAYQFTKRYAQPYLVVKTDDAEGAKKMFSFLNGGGTQVGKEDEVVMLHNTATGEFFSRLEQMANARIQKAILGRVKTSDLQNGSRAAQQVEADSQQNRIESYLILLANAVQHLVDALVLLNETYGNGIQSKNGLTFEYHDEIKVDKNRADRDKIYAAMGLVFTDAYYEEQLGLDKRYFTIKQLENATQDSDSLKMSALSLKLAGTQNELNPQFSAHQKIMAQPIERIQVALNTSDDFATFSAKLSAMGEQTNLLLIDKLVADSTRAWAYGANNVQGAKHD
ncbi:hypothetical protein QEO94_11275 [Kingella negevensis]|uniref:phage portal protein family protein n=1 Tax=Kingella negevensis TaxID=1522312 RepID=UPI0025437535|nr:hypothetical protein [Kingella negevensis]WII93180.1 hypothetical protein QEO94_11275 [Kingella negevensis]